MAPRSYQIMDVRLTLDSDSEELLGMFEQDYAWFAGPGSDGGKQLSVCLSERNQVLRINDVALPLQDHPHPAAYAYQVIGRMLMGAIRDYYILHAAVAAKGQKAVIMCGASGSGKTTLTLGLLEAGLRLLSDDFCPIHKETGLVHPFPRSLWVSRQSKFAGRGAGEAPRFPLRGDKIPLKPSSPGIAQADGPCQAHALICLDPGDGLDAWHEFQIGLKSAGEAGFLQGIKEIGNQFLVERIDPELSEWQIRYPQGQGLTKAVRRLLAEFREHIWNVFRVNGGRPDFAREPALTPIPRHEAVYLLMKELKQEMPFGPGLAGLNPGVCFMELSKLFEGVACYRLITGRADAVRDLVLETFG